MDLGPDHITGQRKQLRAEAAVVDHRAHFGDGDGWLGFLGRVIDRHQRDSDASRGFWLHVPRLT